MKKILFLLLFVTSAIYAQPPGQWMWIHGTNVPNAPANWGVQGVPSPTNVPRGFYEPCQWTDLNGNFWLYGGLANDFYNALWKYEPVTNMWTWMNGPSASGFAGNFGVQGVPSPTNMPPCLSWGAATWTDLQGNLWLFGGYGGLGGVYSALWKYEISTNTWTWMKGPSTTGHPGTYGTQGVPDINNTPRARSECAAAWTDNSGDLWLFGGMYADHLNDLWRYNIATNTWTWMKGSSIVNQLGVYGTLNVEDSANTPGARFAYAHWKDNQGNLWLMGGQIPLNSGSMNDFWKYNISTNNWTWKGGYQSPDVGGAYGTLCSPIPPFPQFPNIPGARYENRSVITDQNGNFWLFGGARSSSFLYVWNDLWMYCVSTDKWIWQSGSNLINPTGNWGTINVPSASNVPDGRGGAVTWYDGNNHIYMFGGSGVPYMSAYNDLWRYTIDPGCYACPVVSVVDAISNNLTCYGECIGSAGVVASGGTPPYTYLWSNSQTTQTINALCAGTYTVTVTDSIGFYTTSSVTITQPLAINSNIVSFPTDASCIGSASVFPSGGTPPYQLLWSNSSTSSTINNLCSGWYYVTITDANDCVRYDSVFVNLNTGIHPLIPEDFNLFFNSTTGELNIDNITFTVKGVEVYDMIGQSVYNIQPNTGSRPLTVDISHLKPGMYFVKVISSNKIFVRKIVKL